MTKKYTQDWFDRSIPDMKEFLGEFMGVPDVKFLEVGSYEGRSTCWFLDNILTAPTSSIYCLDLWEKSGDKGAWSKELYSRYNMPEVFMNFTDNVSEYGEKVSYKVGDSHTSLRSFTTEEYGMYDFIYIDGSHIAADVIEDIILAFPLLKPGGIMAFDDYTWDFFGDKRRHPQMAIDAFLSIYEGRYELLKKDRQVFIRKIRQPLHGN